MNGAGDKLLAHARFPLNDDRRPGTRDLANQFAHAAQAGAAFELLDVEIQKGALLFLKLRFSSAIRKRAVPLRTGP